MILLGGLTRRVSRVVELPSHGSRRAWFSGRLWVVEYLAIDEFQQPKFWRRLFQFFDDLRVLVGVMP